MRGHRRRSHVCSGVPRSRADTMNVDGRDIYLTLEYRIATALVRLLPTGLLLIFLALTILVLMNPDRESIWTFVGIGICFVFGIGVIWIALWNRSRHGKPLFTLSPVGIRYRIAWVREFVIPWREIKGLDTVDVEGGYWSMLWSTHTLRYNTITFHDVTVVLVPKILRRADFRQLALAARSGLERQLHSEGSAGPGRVAPRTCIGGAEAASRRGRSAVACVSRSADHGTGQNQRATRDGGGDASWTPGHQKQTPWRWAKARSRCRSGRPSRSARC